MIHYSCDRCRREIDALHDLRYIVRLEIEPARDRNEVESVDHTDHLLELDEMLDEADDFGGSFDHHQKQYDLCVDCYRQFCKNPLGREVSLPFGFSQN